MFGLTRNIASMMKKVSTFKNIEEGKKAFDDRKEAIVRAPILVHLDLSNFLSYTAMHQNSQC